MCRIVSFFSAVFMLLSCEWIEAESECDRLFTVTKKIEVENALLAWVDASLDSSLALNDYKYGGGVFPGEYSIPDVGFNWDLLGMDTNVAGIRIVTGAALAKEPVQSVSFAEMSRISVIVRKKSSNGFGIKDVENLKKVTNRVAIYCFKKEE